jgi:hypothetical protein
MATAPVNDVTPGLTALAGIPVVGPGANTRDSLQSSLEDAQIALEQRYANPNWFNVAAGFFKPQLGGFAASLGSAAQVLGENVEQQRANQIPLFNVRAQVGAMQAQRQNREAAAKEFEKAKTEGFSPDKLAALQARLSSLGANDLADSVNKMLEAQQKERSMSASEYGNAMATANALYAAGQLSKAGLATKVKEIQSQFGPKPRGAAAPAEATIDAGAAAAPLAAAAAPVAAAEPEGQMGFVPGPGFKGEDQARLDTAMSPELRKAYERLAAGDPSAAKEIESLVREGARLGAVPSTSSPKLIPAKPAEAKKQIITSPLGSEAQGLSPEVLNARIEANESEATKNFNALKSVAGPGGAGGTGYKPISNVVDSQIQLLKDNRDLTKQVTAILTKGNLWSQFQAAVDEGVGFNLQGLTGQVRLPVKTFITAGFNEDQLGFLQTLANNYAKISAYQQKMAGINPNAASNIELNLNKALTPTTDTVNNAAIKSLAHFKIDLDAMHDQYKFVNDVYHGRHPEVALASDVPDKYHSIFAHPTYDKLYDKHQARHDQLNATYQAHLKNAQAKKPKTP